MSVCLCGIRWMILIDAIIMVQLHESNHAVCWRASAPAYAGILSHPLIDALSGPRHSQAAHHLSCIKRLLLLGSYGIHGHGRI